MADVDEEFLERLQYRINSELAQKFPDKLGRYFNYINFRQAAPDVSVQVYDVGNNGVPPPQEVIDYVSSEINNWAKSLSKKYASLNFKVVTPETSRSPTAEMDS